MIFFQLYIIKSLVIIYKRNIFNELCIHNYWCYAIAMLLHPSFISGEGLCPGAAGAVRCPGEGQVPAVRGVAPAAQASLLTDLMRPRARPS